MYRRPAHSMRRRALVAALALPLVVVACGGSKHPAQSSTASSAGAAAAVAAAVDKTTKADSEHLDIVAATKAVGQAVTITGSGDFDGPKKLGKLDATIGLAGIKAQLSEVMSGTAVYVSAPALFSSFLPAGKTWLKIDLATAGKALGLSSAVFAAQDPSSALAQLKAITDLQELGTATLGGVQTTHYRGVIDKAKLPAAESAALAKTGTSFGPYDVWVGSDGYVHKVRVVTISTVSGQSTRTTAAVTLSKFGEGVIVSVPPASETVDSSKLSIPGLSG